MFKRSAFPNRRYYYCKCCGRQAYYTPIEVRFYSGADIPLLEICRACRADIERNQESFSHVPAIDGRGSLLRRA